MTTVAAKKIALANKSGIYPAANRVLVSPDKVKIKADDSLIQLPEAVQKAYEQAESCGTLVAVGPDAFKHVTRRIYNVHDNGQRELIEEQVSGYSEPFANIGDRISFAKYTGQVYRGEDGERYLVLNDEDITCKVSDKVRLTNLDTRKGLGDG